MKFLEPFSKRRKAYRHGHNIQAVMKHPQAELVRPKAHYYRQLWGTAFLDLTLLEDFQFSTLFHLEKEEKLDLINRENHAQALRLVSWWTGAEIELGMSDSLFGIPTTRPRCLSRADLVDNTLFMFVWILILAIKCPELFQRIEVYLPRKKWK